MWRKYFHPGIKYSSSLFLIRYKITFFLICFNFKHWYDLHESFKWVINHMKAGLGFLLAEYVIRIWILEHKGNIKSISLDIPFNSIDHHKSNFNVISFKKYSRNIHKRTLPSSTIPNGDRIVHKWLWNGYKIVFDGFCGKKTQIM